MKKDKNNILSAPSGNRGGLRAKTWMLAAASAAALAPQTFSQAPISQAYSYQFPPLVDGSPDVYPLGSPSTFPNTGPTTIDPFYSSSATFVAHSWSGTAAVPNSQQARLDASVPAGYFLQSITISYSAEISNWLAIDNLNVAPDTFEWSYSSRVWLIRDFNGDLITPGGAAEIANALSTAGPFSVDLAGDLDGGVSPPVPGFLPFAVGYQGADSYVVAPSTAYTPGVGSTRVDPQHRSVANSTPLAGAEFIVWEGVTPGTVSLSLISTGTAGAFTPTFDAAFRAFSFGGATVTYLFVPEASSVAASFAGLLLVGAVSFRRFVK